MIFNSPYVLGVFLDTSKIFKSDNADNKSCNKSENLHCYKNSIYCKLLKESLDHETGQVF